MIVNCGLAKMLHRRVGLRTLFPSFRKFHATLANDHVAARATACGAA
jgi:hypothetical protein